MAKSKPKKSKKSANITPEAPESDLDPAGEPAADAQPVNSDLPGIEGPGVALPRIKALDKATAAYVAARNARMALTEEEVSTKQALAILMHEHNLTTYKFDDYVVKIIPGKENIKVKNAADEGETLGIGGGDEGDGE